VKKLVWTAFLLAAGWFLWNRLQPPGPAPGAFLATEPSQGFAWPLPFKREGFPIYPVASFRVDARVLSRQAYQDGMPRAVSLPWTLRWHGDRSRKTTWLTSSK
jgi:hypothetical protein